MSRLYMALAAFVVLGVLSWATLSNPKLRFATLAVLAMFALKTWLRRNDVMHPDGGSETEPQ
jgi:membrane protein implicated in regulation of membrane protease activity